uniref:Hypothetical secreted peptide n=1 Tax=Glossina morsitans morsitans TaxID=37546 RepID=D3TSF9_GLOMM
MIILFLFILILFLYFAGSYCKSTLTVQKKKNKFLAQMHNTLNVLSFSFMKMDRN